MTIGIPRALMYYRYGALWQTFFERLGCEVALSGAGTQQLLARGEALSDNECCLPVKVFAGHCERLVGRCDYLFAPRFERLSASEEFCVRFWGLTDVVRSTFPRARVLSYNLCGAGSELPGFLQLGKRLGASRGASLRAYREAKEAQRTADFLRLANARQPLQNSGVKVLVAAQPYIAHDPLIAGSLLHALREQGATPIFPEAAPPGACRARSFELTSSLYWTLNKEVVGATALLRPHVDGVILVSAFPCGTDSIVNELILRRLRGIPVTQIILDGLNGDAGLQTRIECFLEIIRERRRHNAS